MARPVWQRCVKDQLPLGEHGRGKRGPGLHRGDAGYPWPGPRESTTESRFVYKYTSSFAFHRSIFLHNLTMHKRQIMSQVVLLAGNPWAAGSDVDKQQEATQKINHSIIGVIFVNSCCLWLPKNLASTLQIFQVLANSGFRLSLPISMPGDSGSMVGSVQYHPLTSKFCHQLAIS